MSKTVLSAIFCNQGNRLTEIPFEDYSKGIFLIIVGIRVSGFSDGNPYGNASKIKRIAQAVG